MPLQLISSSQPEGHKFSDEELEAPYLEYTVVARHRYHSGSVQLPLAGTRAGNGATSRVVQLSAPQSQKVVEFVVTRIGKKPTLPHPETDDKNLVLLEADISPSVPGVTPDGRFHTYTVTGRYVYALRTAFEPGDTLSGVTAPAYTTQLPEVAVEKSQFKKGLF